MMAAVKLNGQLYSRTVEIQDVAADAVLSKEFQVKELLVADVLPENSLGVGLISAKSPAVLLQGWVVVRMAHLGLFGDSASLNIPMLTALS
jgi:hypothetical protein